MHLCMLQFSGLLTTDAVAVKYIMDIRFTISVAVIYVLASGIADIGCYILYVTALMITDYSGHMLRL